MIPISANSAEAATAKPSTIEGAWSGMSTKTAINARTTVPVISPLPVAESR
jgi:hypothetical protein